MSGEKTPHPRKFVVERAHDIRTVGSELGFANLAQIKQHLVQAERADVGGAAAQGVGAVLEIGQHTRLLRFGHFFEQRNRIRDEIPDKFVDKFITAPEIAEFLQRPRLDSRFREGFELGIALHHLAAHDGDSFAAETHTVSAELDAHLAAAG